MASQTQRLMIASLAGFSGTIEKFTQPNEKRQNNPFVVVKGDGKSRAEYVNDPVKVVEIITLSMAVSKNDAFVGAIQNMWEIHLKTPFAAGDVVITSYNDDGSVLTTLTLVQCVIQDVKYAAGDTASHTEAMMEVMLQPSDFISE